MLNIHVYSIQLLMLNTVLIILTHIYLSLHDTWYSPVYLLWSFWLPWTCMFRFWSLDWSRALHRRSSLFLGAGWLVLAPSVPEPSCKLGDLPLCPWASFAVQIVNFTFVPGCDIMYMYQYITLCDNFVILMLECILPRASALWFLFVLMLSVYT